MTYAKFVILILVGLGKQVAAIGYIKRPGEAIQE